MRCWAHAPAASSRASASRLCRTRRNVDSHGTAPVTPSPSKVAWSASAAHSAIATKDRAPASTAHTARARITAIGCRTPRRALGSGNAASNGRMPVPSRPSARAAASNWPIAGSIGDDGAAGMAPRKRSGRCRNRHDHFPGRARAVTAPHRRVANPPDYNQLRLCRPPVWPTAVAARELVRGSRPLGQLEPLANILDPPRGSLAACLESVASTGARVGGIIRWPVCRVNLEFIQRSGQVTPASGTLATIQQPQAGPPDCRPPRPASSAYRRVLPAASGRSVAAGVGTGPQSGLGGDSSPSTPDSPRLTLTPSMAGSMAV